MVLSDQVEIANTLKAYVDKNYKGDFKAAFMAEDADKDGLISTREITVLLAKAGIGLVVTRWAAAVEIVQRMDKNSDGKVSWDEFNNTLNNA